MDELTKSIDALVEDFFAESETVEKASENFEVANANKTTADAVVNAAPKMENDESRGAGRPKDDHDVPSEDEDGNKAKGYDAVQKEQGEEENAEAKKQASSVSQTSEKGHFGTKPSMKDPRLSKSLTDEEYAEYQAFKKAQVESKEKAQQEELKKAEELKKVEQTNLIKAAVESALGIVRKENEELKKAMTEQGALIKAMASQPRQAKSVTSIEVLEKSQEVVPGQGGGTFSKAEILDAAEALMKAGKISMNEVIEIDNCGTVFNAQTRKLIEQKLQG